jgi:hypothetical protein
VNYPFASKKKNIVYLVFYDSVCINGTFFGSNGLVCEGMVHEVTQRFITSSSGVVEGRPTGTILAPALQ